MFFRELVQALPSNDVHHRDATLSQTFSEQKSEAREKYCSTKLSDRRGPKVLGDTNYRGKEDNEDTDNDSDIGVTADGVRPDSGATTDAGAGADEGNAGDSAGEREEGAPRAGAEQTAGKT